MRTHTHTQFFERGQFADVKKAKWNDKVVAVKLFSQVDRKCGFREEASFAAIPVTMTTHTVYTMTTAVNKLVSIFLCYSSHLPLNLGMKLESCHN